MLAISASCSCCIRLANKLTYLHAALSLCKKLTLLLHLLVCGIEVDYYIMFVDKDSLDSFHSYCTQFWLRGAKDTKFCGFACQMFSKLLFYYCIRVRKKIVCVPHKSYCISVHDFRAKYPRLIFPACC